MGTDIHLYVERRVAGKWVSCDTWEPDEYDEAGRLTVRYGKHWYDARSYDTFSILANVRNGHGFAGVDTGDGYVPISGPRGLPDDLSPELAIEVSRFLDHTPTWLSLADLMNYDWTRVTTKRGLVNGIEFDKWNQFARERGDGPDSWCGGTNGETLSIEEMERRIKAIDDLNLSYKEHQSALSDRVGRVYCQISWQLPYYKAARTFIAEVLPRLWRLGTPEDVRIVFWFDS